MKDPSIYDIPGFEGEYKITPSGDVLSYKTPAPKELKQFTQMYDYNIINLSKKGSAPPTTFLIHLLVMNTYGPPRPWPAKNYVCTHLDKDKKNNNISNLKWIKRSDVRTKPRKPVKAIGVDDKDVIYFRSVTDCCKYFHTSQSLIRHKITAKKVYKGYLFEDYIKSSNMETK